MCICLLQRWNDESKEWKSWVEKCELQISLVTSANVSPEYNKTPLKRKLIWIREI